MNNIKNNLVSVLIPSYNHSKFIKQTLDSVLNDSYPEKEIVIIDDGSTDESDTIIKTWIKENNSKIVVKYISQCNKGITTTLNELKELAEGQFFLILASDDYLLPNSIDKRMRLLRQYPEKMVVFGDAHVVNEKSEIIQNSSIEDFSKGKKQLLLTDEGILENALFHPVFSGPLELINRDIYNIIGNYPEDLKVEDWFFWQRVAINKLAIFLDDYVCCYRRHDSNITNGDNDKEIVKDIIKTCLLNLKLLKISKVKIRFFIFIVKMKLSQIKHQIIK